MNRIDQKKKREETESVSRDLRSNIASLSKGLSYMSEIDSDVESVFFEKKNKDLEVKDVHKMFKQGFEFDSPEFETFYRKVAVQKDWHSQEEKLNAKGFEKLIYTLKLELHTLRLFRIGKVRLRIYLLGLDCEENLQGISMEAFET